MTTAHTMPGGTGKGGGPRRPAESPHDAIQKVLVDCKPGQFALIPKCNLLSDALYQRIQISPKVVKSIRANFSWPQFGVITVCRRRDGALYVADGQSRVTGIETMAHIQTVPSMVYDISDERAEALLLLLVQKNRVNLGSVDLYRAQLQSLHPDALFLHKLISPSGVTISTSAARMVINCPSLLMVWSNSLRPEFTRLWPIFANWLREDSLHSNLLKAIMYIERRMPPGESLSDERWSSRLNQIGPQKLTRATRLYENASSKGEPIWAAGVLDELNKKLHKKLHIRPRVDAEVDTEYA